MKIRACLFKKVVAFCTITAVMLSMPEAGHGLQALAAETDYGIGVPTRNADGKVVYDCIYFGNYWQEDTNGDGKADKQDNKTPIKWRVLSVDGDNAFLVADKILDVQTYNDEWVDVTWEKCTMRSWLNGYGSGFNDCGRDYTGEGDSFISNAFGTEEQEAIITAAVENKDNQVYKDGCESGNDTEDKLFLLSLEDMVNASYGFSNFSFPAEFKTYDEWGMLGYIGNGEVVGTECYGEGKYDHCYICDYTKLRTLTTFAGRSTVEPGKDNVWSEGLDTATSVGYCSGIGTSGWWLRSPGGHTGVASAVSVLYDGTVISAGNGVSYEYNGVVPAFHLNLSHSNLWSKADSVICTAQGIGLNVKEQGGETSNPTEKPSDKPEETKPGTTPDTTPTNTPDNGSGVKPSETPAPGNTQKPENTTVPEKNSVPRVSKVKGVKAKAGKGELQIKWKKIADVAGYQLQISKNKNFKGVKTIALKKSSVKYTVKKLKSRKKYYIRLRAYKKYKVEGKEAKAYGKWVLISSKVK